MIYSTLNKNDVPKLFSEAFNKIIKYISLFRLALNKNIRAVMLRELLKCFEFILKPDFQCNDEALKDLNPIFG